MSQGTQNVMLFPEARSHFTVYFTTRHDNSGNILEIEGQDKNWKTICCQLSFPTTQLPE